jgi:hypothetical protein
MGHILAIFIHGTSSGPPWHPSSGENQGELRTNQPRLTPAHPSSGLRTKKEILYAQIRRRQLAVLLRATRGDDVAANGDQYQLVGDAYVHGVMDGEALGSGERRVFRLVWPMHSHGMLLPVLINTDEVQAFRALVRSRSPSWGPDWLTTGTTCRSVDDA